nr:MAG TPA: Peptidase [Caudoviricetes sp.]
MNPKLTITVDAKNRALSVASGMITVGAKIDVEISGLPGDIPPWGASDAFSGPSARFRLVDECGRDLARYPLAEGDGWEPSGGVLSSLTPVEFDTDRLRRAFRGVAFDDTLLFGVIVDSAVDAAQYAVGRVKVRQWAAASTEDPTVLPDWRETLERLQKDLAEVSEKRDDAVAAKAAAVSAASEAQSSRNAAAASANASSAASDRAHASASDANDANAAAQKANAAAQKANAAAQNAKTDAEAARDRAEAASGDFDGRLKDYAKKEEVKSDLASKADLVGGKVPAAQLPSFVDDVLEYDSVSAFPATGEAGRIFVAKDTNLTYRWSGTQYVEISPSLALGETATTAYPGNKGKAIREAVDKASADFRNHRDRTDNPHGVTAKQVGAYKKDEVDATFRTKQDLFVHERRITGKITNDKNLSTTAFTALSSGLSDVVDGTYTETYGCGVDGGKLLFSFIFSFGFSLPSCHDVGYVFEGTAFEDLNVQYDNATGVYSAKLENPGSDVTYTVSFSLSKPLYACTRLATLAELGETKKSVDTKLSDKADKATTLEGYGITDAAKQTDLEALASKVDAANAALEEVA